MIKKHHYAHRVTHWCSISVTIRLLGYMRLVEETRTTRAVHKLLRQRKLKENRRDTNLILHDWTHQLYFSLHVNYHWYSYTRPIAESIRRASLGGMRSTLASQTLRQQTTMSLIGSIYYFNKKSYLLRVPLLPRDVYNIKLRPLNMFIEFIIICDEQMLVYGYITFWQLSIKECVDYKQCTNFFEYTMYYLRTCFRSALRTLIYYNV